MPVLPDIPALTPLPPGLAGDAAYALFCRPDLSDMRPLNHDTLVRRARRQLRGQQPEFIASSVGPIATFTLAPRGPARSAILIVHGWTSEASFMTAIAEPLRQHGHRVVLLDMPAHGHSPQRAASLIDCARGVQAVANALGPFDSLIAHSIGALAGLLAAEGKPPIGPATSFRLTALVAPPNTMTRITGDFSRRCALAPDQQRAFEHRVARVGERDIHAITAAKIVRDTGMETLIVHSRDDPIIPVDDAIAIAQGVPRGQLALVDDLGHARILYAPPVVRTIRSFFDRQAYPSQLD
ncbi:MAG: alpha/beta fold hydrolase [Pseudomonadota bacterium]